MSEQIYNPNFPIDTTLVKDIPGAIRKKGEELYHHINKFENDRVTDNLTNVSEQVKLSFVTGNADVPNGIYIKINNCWYGFNHMDFVEYSETPTDRLRVSSNKQTYEFREIDGVKIWTISPEFNPFFYYDFFALNKELQKTSQEFQNVGFAGTSYSLEMKKCTKPFDNLPYVKTSRDSAIRTQNAFRIENRFSFSAVVSNISREYSNGETIELQEYSVLLFIRDKFDNIRFGLGYDKDNNLFFLNHNNAEPINFTVDDRTSYSFAITYINGTISILCDGNVIHKVENYSLNEKQLLFSAGDDNNFGSYPNGSFVIGEFNVFDKMITPEENLHLKYNPRCYRFDQRDSYLSLNFEDIAKIKKLK